MLGKDAQIERLAGELLAKHGPRAARVAAERLNEMIDRNNIRGRNLWACVVHAIHQRQGTSPWPPANPAPKPDRIARSGREA